MTAYGWSLVLSIFVFAFIAGWVLSASRPRPVPITLLSAVAYILATAIAIFMVVFTALAFA